MIVRTAEMDDAPAMARVIVDTWLSAHRGQMPEAAWIKRRDEWTYDVSEQGWRRTIAEIADGSPDCVYVADDEAGHVVGVAGGRPKEGADAIGEIPALYVAETHQGRGVGLALVRAVAGHLHRSGMRGLHIAVLAANAPARRFYEAIGGRVVSERLFDEGGFMLPEVVYGWADIDELAKHPGGPVSG